MAVAIKLTRILCCATNENEKDGKLDTFIMFAPKSSITRHNLRYRNTDTLKIPVSVIIVKKTPA